MAESKISVSLRQCRNLHSSQHADKWFARAEFGAGILGESERVECASGKAFEVGLDVSLSCSASDPSSLHEIASDPLLVSLLEVLPKDKKAKEEKTNVLGQTVVDLLPLLLGESPLQLTRRLHPPSGQEGPPGARGEGGLGEGKPELDVTVSVSRPILTEEQVARSNILTLRLRSLHSLPDSWQPGTFPFTFTLAFPLPSPGSPPHVTLPNGTLKLGLDKDPGSLSSKWRWPSLPSAVGGASLVEGSHIKSWALEEEQGELNSKEDLKFRRSAECSHSQAIWQVERRCWLPPEANATLLQNLSQCSLWPCEIGRVSVPGGGGRGRGKEEAPTLSCHAVAYLDLSPLLYPGATQIRGAYPLHPFSEPEVAEKTKRAYTAILPSLISSAPLAGTGKKAGLGGAAKRTASSASVAVAGEEGGGATEGEGKSESHVYVEARSYLFLEVEMHHPLIPKRPASVLAERISEYIPPRPPLPRRLGGAERAVQDFHLQTATITDTLLQEYRELFGDTVASGALSESTEAVDERRRQLLFHLNSSGKYHAFKEQLKKAVVKIVREKYLNQIGVGKVGGNNSHAFLSELYVFLTDEMHAGLRKVLSLEDAAPPPPSVLDSELLRHFAVEAEVCRDYELADRYYKERVSRADHVASHWYDYGVFCLLVGNLDKSEQCFREAVALDQRMVPGLLLYGMVCCLDERYSEAEHFFEMATTTEPENAIAWTMRGLYYEHSGNGIYEDMCFQEASKLNLDHAPRTFIAPQATAGGRKGVPQGPGTQSKTSVLGKQQVSLKHPSTTSIVGGALEEGSAPQTQGAVVQSTKSLGGGMSSNKLHDQSTISRQSSAVPEDQPEPQQATAVTELVGTLAHEDKSKVSTQLLNESLTRTTAEQKGLECASQKSIHADNPDRPPAGPEQAHRLADGSVVSMASRQSGNRDPAESQTRPTASNFLVTASYLLDVHALKFGEMSLAHDLTLPSGGPSPQHLVAQARLHLHKEEWGRAEQCLRSAIELDFQDSTAWALLGHALYLTEDHASARDAYERTIHYVNLPAHIHAVYLRLGDIYLGEKEYEKAKEMFLHACRRSPSSVTWRGVGIACYRLGDVSQAEDALCEANLLNNLDPIVWGYLTLVCMKTERPVEAEQALKFAIKAGLSDPSLIGEIQDLQRACPQLSISLSQIPKTVEVA